MATIEVPRSSIKLVTTMSSDGAEVRLRASYRYRPQGIDPAFADEFSGADEVDEVVTRATYDALTGQQQISAIAARISSQREDDPRGGGGHTVVFV